MSNDNKSTEHGAGLPPLPEPFNSNRPYGRAGFFESPRASFSPEQMRQYGHECYILGSVDATDDSEFRNFHRLLCDRFGYRFDPVDWKRDQASLIEYIDELSAALPAEKPAAAAERGAQGLTCHDLTQRQHEELSKQFDAADILEQMGWTYDGDIWQGPAPAAARLTKAEQQVMHTALKKSVTLAIPPAQAAEPAQVDEARFDPESRARLIAIAKDCAANDPERHSYTRGARGDWMPHEWVLKAMAAALTQRPAAPAAEKFARVPKRMTRAMREVVDTEGWEWRDLLAAAEAITEAEYDSECEDTRPAAPLATDAGIVNTHANALRAYIDNLSGEAFQGAIRHLGALRDIIDHLAAHPAAERPAQGEAVAWCSLTPNGKIEYFDGKPMIMPGPVGNEHHKTPLYAHPIAPRAPEGGRNDTGGAEA